MCPHCKVVKSIEKFGSRKSSKDGMQYLCKECLKKQREKNKDNVAVSNKLYRKKNKKKIAAYKKEWAKRNKRMLAIKAREWRKNYPDKVAQVSKKHYLKNKDSINLYHAGLNKKHCEKLSDSYVRRLISSSSSLPNTKVPPELIELKRQYMKINRELKELLWRTLMI